MARRASEVLARGDVHDAVRELEPDELEQRMAGETRRHPRAVGLEERFAGSGYGDFKKAVAEAVLILGERPSVVAIGGAVLIGASALLLAGNPFAA